MRCFGQGDAVYERYHDEEWGRPQLAEQPLYEKLCLEGLQAGLSWITVLRKRAALREAFGGFDPDAVAGYPDIDALLTDARLIRSRPKLEACVRNARATLALRSTGGLAALLWSAAEDRAAPASWADVPPSTAASAALARTLKKAGFAFVGPTTVYSTMQACGLVNDHLERCPVRDEVEAARQAVR